ncbi:flagellar motor switch protein FliN [Nocardioides sp. J54]|uniref:flagellar motor switch protein FliN n=1 Tax=Nocardioides sp. J54 TaxID=935866 RepID=UPI00048B8E75|nr:flagellar motor switch protein FliN [Nocardioides sp. J54]
MTDATPALAEAVAEAAAAVLPSVSPLVLGPVQPGSPHVAAAFAGGAVAELDGGVPGVVAVLVGRELVDALASSPFGGLDVAAAVQPALDAAALRLGARARSASTLDLDAADFDVTAVLGGEFSTVPLIGTGIAAAVLVPEATLAGAREPITEDAGGADAAAPAAAAPASQTGQTGQAGQAGQTAAAAAVAASISDEPFVPAFGSPASPVVPRGLELLHGVDMEVTVELGRTRMTVRDLLALTPGAVLELDRAAGSPADLLVNGRLVARGEVVVVDEDFGLRVTEILDAAATA